jgi:hypothetical protein
MNTTISPPMKTPIAIAAGVIVTVLLLPGCGGTTSSPDSKTLRETAETCLKQQAAQNDKLVEASRELASGAKELVEADAHSRQDFIGLQKDLESSRTNIDQQKDRLEHERRTIAQERRWDSLTATGLMTLGLVLAALSPLLLAGFAVYMSGQPQEASDTANGLIIEEILLPRDYPPRQESRLFSTMTEKQLE